ncbi:MAG: S9 family peptidase [Candidatus Aminicenantes bacterium]|nr:S9 family peptidase [Candidatus Aminicenantes bacterium]
MFFSITNSWFVVHHSHSSKNRHLFSPPLRLLLFLFICLLLFLPSAQGSSEGSSLATQPETSKASFSVEDQSQLAQLFSAWDTFRINTVSTPVISPNGQWILYTKRVRDMKDKDLRATTHIWRVRIDGSERRQMTFGHESCTSPAWFPDGRKFAFLFSRASDKSSGNAKKNKTQIYFMYFDGGEAWAATNHSENITYFQISPDGRKILFISPDPLTEEEKKKQKEKDDAEVVDEKFRMSHLWIYDVETKRESRLTEGQFTISEARWSPDSSLIAFVRRPNPKIDERWNSDVYLIEVATKKTRKLFSNPGPDFSPRWSPDGRFIALAANPHPKTSTWYNKLYLLPVEGGQPKILLQDFDRDFSTPIWSPDGQKIYWSTGDQTSINLFAVEVNTGRVQKLKVPNGANYSFYLSLDGQRWAWVHRPPLWPGEIYTADLNFQHPLRLSEANPWLKKEKKKFGQVKVIRWKNSDGQWIEGVLTYPVDYQPGKKYPLILNPHGGPSGAVLASFSSINQFFASNGFFVLQPNFRGSSNYGQEFLNANRDQWGIVDYDDCMTGVDYCINQGWADPEKLVCYGWSYGGYMSFWIATQTDRFKAISPGAGLPNLISMYSTTDIPHYLAWFFGTPWDNEKKYFRHSPLHYVKQVKSPILILHGAEDRRVPPTQAMEFYQALKDLGKEVTFVRYPREGHGLREPRHQLDRLRRYLDFFCRHLGLQPITEKKGSKPPTTQEKK